MSEIRKYHEQKLSELTIKKDILISGTEILVCSAIYEGGHVDFLRLSNILKAYQDAYDGLKADREYHEKEIELDIENERSIIETGGEKNDSESL